VVVADHQSAGLGRRGRSWTAPPDSSVALSVVLAAPEPELVGWVPLVTGLAVAQALSRSRYAVPTLLKWPNDVLAQEEGDWRKICGVLAQAVPDSPAGPVVVAGAGINIDQVRAELPVPTATSWRLVRGGPHGGILPDGAREQLVDDVLDRLADLVTDLPAARPAYRRCCSTIGSRVTVHLPGGGTHTGTAVDVDEAGALVVEGEHGQRTRHLAGDVVHLRPAG
jgi:BirA family biotin operon repressor/biotin-[acetyl-CoA-carboxylase] ligase